MLRKLNFLKPIYSPPFFLIWLFPWLLQNYSVLVIKQIFKSKKIKLPSEISFFFFLLSNAQKKTKVWTNCRDNSEHFFLTVSFHSPIQIMQRTQMWASHTNVSWTLELYQFRWNWSKVGTSLTMYSSMLSHLSYSTTPLKHNLNHPQSHNMKLSF